MPGIYYIGFSEACFQIVEAIGIAQAQGFCYPKICRLSIFLPPSLLSCVESPFVADTLVDEEEDVLAETELTNAYIARRRSEKATNHACADPDY